jgi:hypothetical protein
MLRESPAAASTAIPVHGASGAARGAGDTMSPFPRIFSAHQAKVNEYLPGGINGYYNGFWTSDSRQLGTHTDAYFRKMWELLQGAKSENEVVSALNKLKQMAQSGAF